MFNVFKELIKWHFLDSSCINAQRSTSFNYLTCFRIYFEWFKCHKTILNIFKTLIQLTLDLTLKYNLKITIREKATFIPNWVTYVVLVTGEKIKRYGKFLKGATKQQRTNMSRKISLNQVYASNFNFFYVASPLEKLGSSKGRHFSLLWRERWRVAVRSRGRK